MTTLTFTVPGAPSAQGSKKHVGNGRMVDMNKNLQPWRDSIVWAALAADSDLHREEPLFMGPVSVDLTFVFPRPKSHHRTGKRATELRDDAPLHKTSAPDLDKLVRAFGDAITASGVWRDDSQAVAIRAEKIYGQQPRLDVVLTALDGAAA